MGKTKAILFVSMYFLVIVILFYALVGAVIFKPILYPFNLNNYENKADSYCWMSASVALSNLTRDPIYKFGDNCCTITQDIYGYSYDFKCVKMNKTKMEQWVNPYA